MGCVIAFVPDLLFGSRVQADLLAHGHDIELVGDSEQARERVADVDVDVLVVDLTDELAGGAELVENLLATKAPDQKHPRTLGFYAHVDVATRERAEQAGFDMVVARSRMAREGATLVGQLATLPR